MNDQEEDRCKDEQRSAVFLGRKSVTFFEGSEILQFFPQCLNFRICGAITVCRSQCGTATDVISDTWANNPSPSSSILHWTDFVGWFRPSKQTAGHELETYS
jgi:hypothetical protein